MELVSCVLLIKNNRILLVKHGPRASIRTGMYGLPGGSVEKGENLKEAAIRELEEETGLKTQIEGLKDYPGNVYGGYIRQKEGMKEFKMTVFIGIDFEGHLRSTDETTPFWLELSKLGEYELLPGVESVIKDGMRYL